jgi:hypothetical protein
MNDDETDLARFVRGDCDPRQFAHREHVRMGFEMLRRHSFAETVLHYSQALRTMTTRIGRPDVYHETITIAFLSLVAERMDAAADFDSFASVNADLFDKRILARWYTPERLASDRARRHFLLPEPRR